MLFRKQADGSITLEATIALPIFITFVLAMIIMTKMALFQMAIQSATNETVKQIATHVYPAYVLMEGAKDTEFGQKATYYIDETASGWRKVKEAESGLNSLGIDLTFTKAVEEIVGEAVNAVACATATPIVKSYADGRILNLDNIKVTRVVFDNEYLTIETQYPYKIALPFIPESTIYLRAQATERLWNQCSDYEDKAEREVSFVGSKRSDKYHILGAPCIGRDAINPENLVSFSTQEEAHSAGYVLCKICERQLK